MAIRRQREGKGWTAAFFVVFTGRTGESESSGLGMIQLGHFSGFWDAEVVLSFLVPGPEVSRAGDSGPEWEPRWRG